MPKKKSSKITSWIRRNQWKHLCHCGCGEYIFIERSHFKPSVGIPKFIKGHNLQPVEENYTPPEKPNYWDTLSEEEKQRRLAHLQNFQAGKNNPAWKGGRWLNDAGYMMVLSPGHPFAKDGYVLEHRLVVEEHFRREHPDSSLLIEVDGVKYISPTSVVHHINEVKTNNDISNLLLLENQNAHAFIHHSTLPMDERLRRISLGIYHSGPIKED